MSISIKNIIIAITMFVSVLTLMGCEMDGKEEDKLRDLDFTVVGENEQPDALKDIINEKKAGTFQISYTIGEELYIAVGYGQQSGGGYSIAVNELYETPETIVIDTTLIGPGSAENVTDNATSPYIVIKTENISDKPLEFN